MASALNSVPQLVPSFVLYFGLFHILTLRYDSPFYIANKPLEVISATLIAVAAFLPTHGWQWPPPSAPMECRVVEVTEGDTLAVRCKQGAASITLNFRLAEIDAPEKNQPFGQRSKDSLSRLCFNQVTRLKSTHTDRHGQTVARIECQGQDASLAQVQSGMAWANGDDLADPAVKEAAQIARGRKAGLWRDPHPVAPWEWRTTKRELKKPAI